MNYSRGSTNSRIKSVLLKGGASVASGLYDDPAERFLSDIDVLVATEQIEEAETALRPMVIRACNPNRDRFSALVQVANHHLPPLVPPTGGICHRTSHFIGAVEEIRIAHCRRRRSWNARSAFNGTDARSCSASDRFSDLQYRALATSSRFILLARTIELRQLRELAIVRCEPLRRRGLDRGSNVDFRPLDTGRVLAEQAVYSQALMGVAFPVGEHDAQGAMDRLRSSIMNPDAKRLICGVWGELANIYIGGFTSVTRGSQLICSIRCGGQNASVIFGPF